MRLIRLLQAEDGIALIMALGVLIVLGLTSAALLEYTSTNSRSATRSASYDKSYRVAEAGLNEALAVLTNAPTVNPSASSALANVGYPRTTNYPTGSVTTSASYDSVNSIWTITSRGQASNPTGASGLLRALTVKARVTPPAPQPVVSSAWNYVYSFGTTGGCDMLLAQSVVLTSPLYAAGNLCLANSAKVAQGGNLDVRGSLIMNANQNAVGTSAARVARVQLGTGCNYSGNGLHNPCLGDADNVFVQAGGLGSSPALVPAPSIGFQTWYDNASPGPMFPCTTQSGTPPTFDTGDGLRNNSISAVQNLTPGSSYTCRTNVGELSWNASTKVLTISGTVYIDGSATIDPSGDATYSGQGAIYLSGTMLMKNVDFCAVLRAGSCDTAAWDPNQKMLVIVTDGNGGQLPAGDGIQLKGASFQGALYATNVIDMDTTSDSQGPMIAKGMNLGQKTSSSWPALQYVPPGLPGNPPVFATVTPFDYTG